MHTSLKYVNYLKSGAMRSLTLVDNVHQYFQSSCFLAILQGPFSKSTLPPFCIFGYTLQFYKPSPYMSDASMAN